MSEQLRVTLRESRGKHRNRRLRAGGQIPAVLYGHGQETVSLAVTADAFAAALRHGAQVVNLVGDVTEQALIREIQWDFKGVEALHADFYRVSQEERVEVEVPLQLRGMAPGTRLGGVVAQLLHALPLECPVMAIPEKLEVNINELEIGDAIHVKDLELPHGAVPLVPADEIIVQCTEAIEELPEEEEAAAEPELIGRDREEEETEEGQD